MAKAKKKSAKEASNTFHNIMAASVKGNKMKRIFIDEEVGQNKETYLIQIFDRGADTLTTIKHLSGDNEVDEKPTELYSYPNVPLQELIKAAKKEVEIISTPK